MQAEENRRDAVREADGHHTEGAAGVEREPHERDVVQRVAELAGGDGQEQTAKVWPAEQPERAVASRPRRFELARMSRTGSDTACAVSPPRRENYTRDRDCDARADGRRSLPRRGVGCRGRAAAGTDAVRLRARRHARGARRRRSRGPRRARAHLRREHGIREVRLQVDPRGAERGAAAPPAPLARLRCRRALSRLGRACERSRRNCSSSLCSSGIDLETNLPNPVFTP